jgi:hypothetical protein
MGAHLGHGTVVGECLRCPLHHWSWDGSGGCRAGGSVAPCDGPDEPHQRAFPVVEQFGGVFAFNGDDPPFAAPTFPGAEATELRTLAGAPVTVDCPHEALVANAFDTQHLQAVHGRALREPPVVTRPDRWRIRLEYVSRVTGHGLADHAMKWLSGDRIAVSIECTGGSVVTVDSRAGHSHSQLMLGLTSLDAERTIVTPIFAVRRAGFAALQLARLLVSRWLFTSFLRKDVSVMERMRWRPRPDGTPAGAPLDAMLEFLAALPRAARNYSAC